MSSPLCGCTLSNQNRTRGATTTLEEKRPKNPIEAPKLKGFHQRKLVIISR